MQVTHQFTRSLDGTPSNGGVYPIFYIEPMEDRVASAQNGRPIFKDVEMVRVIMPGNQLNEPVYEVTDVHRARWAPEYEAFRKGNEPILNGTPLEHWPPLGKSLLAELKYFKFRTVEDLAGAPDNVMQRIPHGFRLRESARAWLDEAVAGALTEKQSFEIEQLRADNANLQRQVKELGELVRQNHAEIVSRSNQLHPYETTAPASIDPLANRGPAPQVAESSLAGFEVVRRRPGRPRKTETEGEEAAA